MYDHVADGDTDFVDNVDDEDEHDDDVDDDDDDDDEEDDDNTGGNDFGNDLDDDDDNDGEDGDADDDDNDRDDDDDDEGDDDYAGDDHADFADAHAGASAGADVRTIQMLVMMMQMPLATVEDSSWKHMSKVILLVMAQVTIIKNQTSMMAYDTRMTMVVIVMAIWVVMVRMMP